MVLNRIKRAFSGSIDDEEFGEEYLEIDLGAEEKEARKVLVKLFVLKQYDEVNEILNALREGYTIALIDYRILEKKDPIELKRAVSKIKKTTEALEGNIAGHDKLIIVTPSVARISKESPKPTENPESKFDSY